MQKVTKLFGLLILISCLAMPAFGYEAIPFKNGGSIEGVAKFVGDKVPQDPTLTLTSETKECGTSKPAKKYLIRDRKIQNVVVFIVGIKAGKPFPAGGPVTVTNHQCEFQPHVAVGFKGNSIALSTDDPILHMSDVHLLPKGKELFHVSLHEKGTPVKKKLSTAGLLEMSCYNHPWEHAYVYVFDHPYVAVTDEQGRFTIDNIPPGTYTVEAWHEALGTKKISDIKVESGKTSTIKLEFSGTMNRK